MADENQEPAWLAAITDPALREQARKEFLLQADYTKKTQELAEQRRQVEAQVAEMQAKLAAWEDFGTKMAPHWDSFKAWSQQVRSGQPQQPQAQAQTNLAHAAQNQGLDFSNWEYLPEQERVNRILAVSEARQAEAIAQRERQWAEAIGNAMRQANEQNYRYFNLVVDALGRKIETPGLKLSDLLKEAQALQDQIVQGKFNPLDLAYQRLISPEQEEKKKAEYMKLGEEEYKRRLENEKQAAGVTGSGPVPISKQQPRSPGEITQAVRAEADKAGIPWVPQ